MCACGPIAAAATPARARLLRRLDAGAALTVVWGPAGYGKTTLVESWLAVHPETVAIRVPAPEGVSAQTYWAGVTVRASGARSGAVLVLDRPDLALDPGARDRLQDIRRDHPELRVMVTVRDAGLFWDHWLSRSDVTVVGPAELEFTAAEAVALCAAHGVDDVSERTIRDGLRLSGGHPALVTLSLRVAHLFGSLVEFERARAHSLVLDGIDEYVESALLAPIGSPLRAQALELAPMGRVSVGAASVLGLEDAGHGILALERAGLLSRAPGTPEPGWRFPGPVRDALLRIAAREGVRTPASVVARLARWFAADGDPVNALCHATRSRQWDLVVDLVLAHGVEVAFVAMPVLSRALTALPDPIVRSSSVLYYARELVARVRSDRPRSVRRMLTSSRELEEVAVARSVEHAVLGGALRSVVYRWQGDYAEAVRHHGLLAEMSAGLLATLDVDAVRAAHLPFLWLHLGRSSQLHDDHDDAAYFFGLAHASGDGLAGRSAAGHLALLHAVHGETGEAERWLGREEEFDDHPGRLGVLATIPGDVARGLVALDRMDVARAEAAVDVLPGPEDSAEHWMFVEYVRCQLDLLRGEPEIGLDRLERVTTRFRTWMTSTSLSADLLGSASMELRLAAGGVADVAARAHRLRGRTHPLVGLAAARSLLLSGDPGAAVVRSRKLAARSGRHTRVRVEALLIEATALSATGDTTAARTTWNRAVALSRDTGLVRPLASVPGDTARQLSEQGRQAPEAVLRWCRGIYPEPVVAVELSERERAVLAGLISGDSVAVIAESLFVSVNTVKSQLKSLYRKLGVHSRGEALEAARLRGLV